MRRQLKKHIAILLIIIFVVIVAGFLGWFIANGNTDDIEGIIITKEENVTYETRLITTYSEYQSILNEYNALGKITQEDFNTSDYIVDYIPYIKNMTINSIDVNMGEVITITYDLSVDNKDSNRLLVNFIPIEKGKLISLPEVNQKFK